MTAKEKLLQQARRQFWAHGYSNVSLRQLASAVDVDVALISRYYGSKRGLFEATLTGAFEVFRTPPADAQALMYEFVRIFVETPRSGNEPSAIRMLLTNAHDEDVGEMVRQFYDDQFQVQICKVIGNTPRAAMFMSVVFGISVAEKSLKIRGFAPPESKAYEAQLRHLLNAALTSPVFD